MKDHHKCYRVEFCVLTDNEMETYCHSYDYIVYAKDMEEARRLALDYALKWYEGEEEVTVTQGEGGYPCCEFKNIGSTVSVTDLRPETEDEYIQYLLGEFSINKPKANFTKLKESSDTVDDQVIDSILGGNVKLIKAPSDDGGDQHTIVIGSWRSDVESLALGKSILSVLDRLL